MTEEIQTFVEIYQTDSGADETARLEEVETYVSAVEPKLCGKVIKQLSALCPLTLRLPEAEEQETMNDGLLVDDESKSGTDICLGHLKRVRRPVSFVSSQDNADSKHDPSVASEENSRSDSKTSQTHQKGKKRRRSSNGEVDGDNAKKRPTLEVLVGTTKRVDALLRQRKDDGSNPLRQMIDQNGLALVKRMLPGRPAKSQSELDEWHVRTSEEYAGVGWWPTIFFNKQTEEFREEERKLTKNELRQMETGMEAAVADGRNARRMHLLEGGATSNSTSATCMTVSGVAIVDPASGDVVSTSCQERNFQKEQLMTLISEAQALGRPVVASNLPDRANPLCSPVILAIQGVSRRERSAAAGQGMESEDFKNGQYLCTGYDVYITSEPDVFEAMAITHSRFRRVIYGIPNHVTGGLGGAGSATAVFSLPGTNHHYRVFQCVTNDDIVAECK